MAMRIDAHQHLWLFKDREYGWMSREMTALRRDFLVPDLEAVLQASGIGGIIATIAPRAPPHHLDHIIGPRQAAGVGRENPVGAVHAFTPHRLEHIHPAFAGTS